MAVAVPSCPPAATWVASRLALGPALACVALDGPPDLPASSGGRFDALVWCVVALAVPADDLRRAVAAIRPRKVIVLVVPAGFLAGDAPDTELPPPLGAMWAALMAAVTDRPVALASAGWSGETVEEALEALAGRLLRDPPGGERPR